MSFLSKVKSQKSKVGQSGFTLLELLVVIAIMGILAAVVITNLSGTRSKANDVTVKTDVNSLGQAVSVGTVTATDVSAFDTGNIPDADLVQLTAAINALKLMPKIPKHPVATEKYNYKSKTTSGILEFVVWGKLADATCFINKSGSSFIGDCVADTNL